MSQNDQPSSFKFHKLRNKLWLVYLMLSIIPALGLGYLISQDAIAGISIKEPRLTPAVIGLGVVIALSITGLVLLLGAARPLEAITQKAIRFAKEHANISLLPDIRDENEKLNACFMELVRELQHKANEINKTTVVLGETNKKLAQMSVKDGLTQLYNQTYIKERLANEFKRAEQFSQPLSILMLDVDDFKKFNDFYGHPAGDKCLEDISDLIRKNVRDIDIPARYGGEEFLVILPGAKSSEASLVAEQIRQSVAKHQFQASGPAKTDKKIPLTISAGIAGYYKDSGIKTIDELIKASESALVRQAKTKGKNQVAVYV